MKTKFAVEGMTCAACQAHVQKAVEKLDGIKSVNVNLLQNNMVVEFDEGICSVEKIESAVAEGGYRAYLPSEKKEEVKKEGKDRSLAKLIASGIILLITMYFSMGNMMWEWPVPPIFDHHENPMGFALVQFILILPIIYIYRGYFISGYKRLFSGSANMDSLIAVGATASVVYGVFALFAISYGQANLALIAMGKEGDTAYFHDIVMTYHDSLYFESAGMILTLVSLGKYLEKLSKKRTTAAVEALMKLAPERAVLFENGVEREVDAKEVKVGDILIVKKGASVPVDGVITEGAGSFDQANITGENLPVYKKEGEEIFSSTTLTAGYIKFRASRVGEDTSIARIIALVDEASNSKAPISRLADKISGIFVPVILTLAVITLGVNILLGLVLKNLAISSAIETALRFAISVVVIACPCALGLATPVAIMVGTGKGAQSGLLIRNAEILERAHNIGTVVLDKTGTITMGKPRVTDYIVLGEDCLSAAASLENKSEHPLASAIVAYAKERGTELCEAESFGQTDGRGIGGRISGREYRIGNAAMMAECGAMSEEVERRAEEFARQGKTPLFVEEGGCVQAIFAVKDEVKENSASAIAELKRRGIKVVMLTGDNKKTAEAIAAEVGVDEVISDVFPEDKQRIVESLKTGGKSLVAMVGDGVNDAPALTSADIGIAIGGGSDVATDAGDIVLLRKDLADVCGAIDLSRRVLNTIKLGLFWAFFYNIICVVIATGALYYPFGISINPMIGSVAMSISSVSVVLNALTINLFKVRKTEKTAGGVTLKVKGMMCEHCVKRVYEACIGVDGVEEAKVDLKGKKVTIKGKNADIEEVKRRIREAGYKV